jgi:hypothetical protein
MKRIIFSLSMILFLMQINILADETSAKIAGGALQGLVSAIHLVIIAGFLYFIKFLFKSLYKSIFK